MNIIEWLIFVLALEGLGISLYFTFAYYGRVKKSRWIPAMLCAREGSSCVTVVQTPYARFLGIPNSLLGTSYYASLIIWSVVRHAPWNENFLMYLHARVSLWIVVAIVFSVPIGFYLIYALRWKLHMHCILCYIAHAINLVLIPLLIAAGM